MSSDISEDIIADVVEIPSRVVEKAREYAQLLDSINHQKTVEGILSKNKETLEQELIDLMIDEGVPQIKIDKVTLFRRTDTFWGPAEGIEKSSLISALANDQRTMDLVSPSYNANSLRSRINDIIKNDGDLGELECVLRKTEKPKIGYRRGQ